jgi:2-iminobutanoate/2-iminopropanoate deaminase
VSGQGPIRDGEVVSGTIEEETEIVLGNLRTIVEAAGATLADVVRVGVFLADLGDFAAMNAVYESTFPAPLPARTTVGAQLPGIKVEIDCVAVLPEGAG